MFNSEFSASINVLYLCTQDSVGSVCLSIDNQMIMVVNDIMPLAGVLGSTLLSSSVQLLTAYQKQQVLMCLV